MLIQQVLQDGRYKAPEELAKVFKSAGVDLKKPIIASCGTGVTASILVLALQEISPSSQVRQVACMRLVCVIRLLLTAQ